MKKIILFLSDFVAVCYLSTAVYSKTTAVQEYKFDIKHIGKASGENTYNLTIHKHCPTEYPYTTSQAKDLKCAAKISRVFNGVKCYRCKEEVKKEVKKEEPVATEPENNSSQESSDDCGSVHSCPSGFGGEHCDIPCEHGYVYHLQKFASYNTEYGNS